MRNTARVMAFLWLTLLASFAGVTVYNIGMTSITKQDAGDARKTIQKMLLDGCCCREILIHLYGGWVRLSGQSVCNEVLRLPGGQLFTGDLRKINPREYSRNVQALHEFALLNGCKFLYVQLPGKMDRLGSFLPKGYKIDYGSLVVDHFLQLLTDAHISFVDTRSALDGDIQSINRYFFKTDHHWNFDGAFKVFPIVVKAVLQQLGLDLKAAEPYLDPAAWERIKAPRTFMGSIGRRVGAIFAEPDEFYYYLPAFECVIEKTIPIRQKSARGSFEEAVVEMALLEKPRSSFVDCGYSLYGNDYDHARYVNHKAPVARRLLITKDSYALPVIAWMTTIFKAIDVIDLRHFKKMTLIEAAKVWQPDLIVTMHNPGALKVSLSRMWTFGEVHGHDAYGRLHAPRDVRIGSRAHDYNHETFEEELEPGATYYLSATGVELTSGSTEFLTVALYDKQIKRVVFRQRLSCKGVLECTVKVPDDTHGYSILLYAGEMGKTAGVGIVWKNVALTRLK